MTFLACVFCGDSGSQRRDAPSGAIVCRECWNELTVGDIPSYHNVTDSRPNGTVYLPSPDPWAENAVRCLEDSPQSLEVRNDQG